MVADCATRGRLQAENEELKASISSLEVRLQRKPPPDPKPKFQTVVARHTEWEAVDGGSVRASLSPYHHSTAPYARTAEESIHDYTSFKSSHVEAIKFHEIRQIVLCILCLSHDDAKKKDSPTHKAICEITNKFSFDWIRRLLSFSEWILRVAFIIENNADWKGRSTYLLLELFKKIRLEQAIRLTVADKEGLESYIRTSLLTTTPGEHLHPIPSILSVIQEISPGPRCVKLFQSRLRLIPSRLWKIIETDAAASFRSEHGEVVDLQAASDPISSAHFPSSGRFNDLAGITQHPHSNTAIPSRSRKRRREEVTTTQIDRRDYCESAGSLANVRGLYQFVESVPTPIISGRVETSSRRSPLDHNDTGSASEQNKRYRPSVSSSIVSGMVLCTGQPTCQDRSVVRSDSSLVDALHAVSRSSDSSRSISRGGTSSEPGASMTQVLPSRIMSRGASDMNFEPSSTFARDRHPYSSLGLRCSSDSDSALNDISENDQSVVVKRRKGVSRIETQEEEMHTSHDENHDTNRADQEPLGRQHQGEVGERLTLWSDQNAALISTTWRPAAFIDNNQPVFHSNRDDVEESRSDCSKVVHSVSPPRFLLVAETLFRDVKACFENYCQNMFFDDYGTLIDSDGTVLPNDLCNEFDSYCFTATILLQRKSFTEFRRISYKASTLVSKIIQDEHPRTLGIFLEVLMHPLQIGLPDVSRLLRRLIKKISTTATMEGRPWGRICRHLGELDSESLDQALAQIWNCTVDIFESELGKSSRFVVSSRLDYIKRVYGFTNYSEENRLLREILARFEGVPGDSTPRLMLNLAHNLNKQGCHGDAEEKAQEALSLLQRYEMYANRSFERVECKKIISHSQYNRGKALEAEQTMREAIRMIVEQRGLQHPWALEFMTVLEGWLRNWGRDGDADTIRVEIEVVLRIGGA